MLSKTFRPAISMLLAAVLVAGVAVSPNGAVVNAAAKKKVPKLSAKSIRVSVKKTKTIKVKNNKKKTVWSVKSGKKFITLADKKKSSVLVKGKKAGKAVVLARVDGKKLTCKVTVAAAKKPIHTPDNTAKPTPVTTQPTTVTGSPEPVDTANPPAETSSVSTGEKVGDITIDLSKCGDTSFSASPAKIDFSSQIENRFDLKLFQSMEVGYELDFDGDAPAGYTGKIGLASTGETLDGFSDGVAFTYNMVPGSNSVSVDLSADTIEGKAVGINVQPMDKDASWGWPANLKSVKITSITFKATPGAIYPAPGVVPDPTPVAGPTYAPEKFVYEGLDTKWIDPEKPMVAFTFDDGPVGNSETSNSMIIQKALKKYGAHATFFYIGGQINTPEKEDEVRQAKENGFEVGNHSWGWNALSALKEEAIKDSIEKTNQKLTELTGYNNFLFRAPNLSISPAMQGYIKAPFINCATDSKDWADASTEQIITNVKKAKDGDVILMHETQKNTVNAIETLLQHFKDEGWQVVSVSELFAVRNKELTTGQVYSNCPR